MRILFLTPSPPRPDGGGAAIRNWYLIQAARNAGHYVDVATFNPDDPGTEGTDCMHMVPPPTSRTTATRIRNLTLSRAPDLALRCRSSDLSSFVGSLVSDATGYDLIQVEGLEMSANLPPIATALQTSVGAVREPPSDVAPIPHVGGESSAGGQFTNSPYEAGARTRPSIIYDAHNAEATLQQRSATQSLKVFDIPSAAYSLIQWLKLRAYERSVIRQAAATLAVSPSDVAELERLSGRTVDVVPIGVDTSRYRRNAMDMSPPIPFDVVFSGTLDYRPNTDAALWLLRAIWPRIRAAKPGATLAIVGRNPTPVMRQFDGKDGITITGEVPDDRPYMAGAGVYVLPIRFGAGMRVKLLNAMSMGCAVVATTMACEGVDLHSGEYLLATPAHPGAFAAATLALLDDEGRRLQLGAAARTLMVERYDWSVVTPALLKVYDRLGVSHG